MRSYQAAVRSLQRLAVPSSTSPEIRWGCAIAVVIETMPPMM